MKIGWIHYRGLLDTEPMGDWCGAHPHVARIAAAIEATIISADWNDPDAHKLVDRARQQYGCQVIIVSGHSHGSWTAKKEVERYGPEAIDVLALVDHCPFLNPAQQLGPPLDFPDAATYGYACWQHNTAPTGCRFNPRDKVVVDDTTSWVGPRLGHVDFPNLGFSSIAGDYRVWARIGAQIRIAVAART